MRYLLDTHTLIWSFFEVEKLSKKAIKILENPENVILVSAASFYELSIKKQIGKFELTNDIQEVYDECKKVGFELLDINTQTAVTFERLKPLYHKDPFDRMLIWQAIQLNIPIISQDVKFGQYHSEGLKVVW